MYDIIASSDTLNSESKKKLVHIYKSVLNVNFVDHKNAFLIGKMLNDICVLSQRIDIVDVLI